MQIKSEEIRKYLKQYDTWTRKVSKTEFLFDPEYYCFPDKVLERYVQETLTGLQWIDKISDCDNFAMWMQSDITKLWAMRKESDSQPAIFGIVVPGTHAINLAWAESGIKRIEPQTGQIWDDDNVKILAIR